MGSGSPATRKRSIMAGKKAGFITGANAKIMIDSSTIAYATNVNYDINVQTVPIEGIGRYEVWSNEPVSYSCNGSLSIIRYTKRASASGISKVDANGNTIDQVETGAAGVLPAGSMAQHMDPSKLLLSQTFDLKIFEKTDDDSLEYRVIEMKDCRLTRRSGNLDKRGVLMDQYTFVGILAGDAGADDSAGISASESGDDDLT